MGVLALILGMLAGLCTIMGIVTAFEVVSLVFASFTETFWLLLAGVLFLAATTSLLSRGGNYE